MHETNTYLNALKTNNGQLDEISLGVTLGFPEEKTKQVINQLLAENKIEFQSFGLCSYRLKE